MKTVTQKAKFRQAVINYAEKYGVTRQYILSMAEKNEGTLQSLMDKSHKPNSYPKQHTEQELKLISDMRRRNSNAGLVLFWVKLRQRGYTRSITGLYRVLIKNGLNPKNFLIRNI